MAIAAIRNKFLNLVTSLPTKEFVSFNDNAVYNTVDQMVDSAVMSAQNNEALLNTLQTSVNDLSEMLMNSDVVDTLKDAMDSAMDTISNMELPDVVNDIFDSVKKLDTQGTKDFLKDLLHVGSSFLCNNLDFLKNFMLGYALNKNILSGLMIGLLLSWLDRYCKEFTKEEMAKSNNKQSLDMMFPPKGVKVDANNSFDLFSNYYSDHLKASAPLPSVTALSNNDFLTNILGGDIKSSMSNLRGAEISHTDRNSYLSTLNDNLSLYPSSSTEYRNILTAKGDLMKTPLISSERRDKNIRFENLSDQLGSYAKNLTKVDLKPVNYMNLSTIEQGLYTKMTELKATAANSSILQCTPNNSFSDFDIGSMMPVLSTEETTFLQNRNVESDSHRYNGLHPTSKVFLMQA